jgi:hypothetical protein
VPDEPGSYTVHVNLDGLAIPDATGQVEVFDTTISESPLLRFESIEWDQSRPPKPGGSVSVDVTWTVLTTPDANYSATLQLLDASGNRVAGYDLLAGGEMPPTTAWQPGQQVTLTFTLPLDAAIPAGDYQLLTAVYAFRDDYPRVRVELPDGSVGTEAIVPGFVIGQ